MKRSAKVLAILFSTACIGSAKAQEPAATIDPHGDVRSAHLDRMAEVMRPVRDFLKEELLAYEKRSMQSGDLDLVLAIRDARIAFSLSSEPGKTYFEFPIDLAAFAKKHGGESKNIEALRKRYIDRLRTTWLPAQKKYVTELADLEKRLVRAGADGDVLDEVGLEYRRNDLESRRPGFLAKLPQKMVHLNGSLYCRMEDKMGWKAAKLACEELGGHLVTITSQEEDDLVKALTQKKDCWMGLEKGEKQGMWKWVTGERLEFTGWVPGEPNFTSGGVNLVHYMDGRGWDDRWAGNLRYICEWDAAKR